MLYIVKTGDTLRTIAVQLGTTVEAIMEANVICNPNLIFAGQPLIIPERGIDLPKAGGSPYYVLHYGDTLWCLSKQFSQSIEMLALTNQLKNPNLLFAGMELMVGFNMPNLEQLFNEWKSTGGSPCEELSSLQIHGIYYIGSYRWEAAGERAIPYLFSLLSHSCDIVRYYTVMSLGRIGKGRGTQLALQQGLRDKSPLIVELAKNAFRRFQLIPAWTKRIHLTTSDHILHDQPNLTSSSARVPKGSPVIVLRWNIPSPTAEEGPRGDIQVYDFVRLINIGQTGYMPRVGFNETLLL